MDTEIRRTESPRPRPTERVPFGTVFSDHVFRMAWDAEQGAWHSPRIEPYGPIPLDPAASALHYAQAIFEGMKAFRGHDGKVRLFRPDRHAARFARSAERLCIPPLPEETFVASIRELVAVDRDWVPERDGAALYVRPLIFASEPFLGVRPARRYEYVVMTCPVDSYYARGFGAVRIWVEQEEVRAVRGGTGEAKTAGNYAASLHAQVAAKARGYDQVLWTDANTHRFVEEVGTMNLFVRFADEVVTPPLEGTILPGITRQTVLELLRGDGLTVNERPLTLEEIQEAHASGQLLEVFGSGTAAVISAVGVLGLPGGDLTVADGEPGPLARSLYDRVTGLQRGTVPDPHGWLVEVP